MTRFFFLLSTTAAALLLCILLVGVNGEDHYGVDTSFPMHHSEISSSLKAPHPLFGETKQNFYNDFLQGCRDYFAPPDHDPDICDNHEHDRIEMNRNQPSVMKNFTTAGFAKIRMPSELMDLLVKFYKDNSGNEEKEDWPPGNTYTNQWESHTYIMSLEDSVETGGGTKTVETIKNAVQPILEQWTGTTNLKHTSLYGIRIYTTGAVLAPHVDRSPLVISCILNVAQEEVEEPWPLEVIGHDGVAHNITMEPGDMVLYESHSVIHGRPFPLMGKSFANVFVHFEPSEKSEYMLDEASEWGMDDDDDQEWDDDDDDEIFDDQDWDENDDDFEMDEEKNDEL